MVKRFFVVASVTLVSTLSACSDETPPTLTPGLEQDISRAIEQGAPSRSSGMTSTVLGAISLAAYPEVLTDGRLRAREVVLRPGARIAIHSHDRRPAIVYVLEGELVEHRNDSSDPIIRREGDLYLEGPDTVHWSENVSQNRVRVLAVDILPDNSE